MPNLLHIDASIRGEDSVSQKVTAAFVEHWRAANPGGGYVYRHLGENPVPYLDAAAYTAGQVAPEQRTPEQRAGWAISEPLIEEVRAADTILLGVPMYNFSIPATLKTWLDRIIHPGFMLNQATGEGALVDKKVVVVTARGGSYAPGTPREGFDYQEPYLRAVFSMIGLDRNLEFIHAELTLAHAVEAMFDLRDKAVESLANAHERARELASV
ncbi:FMN-dependent NADH-azoreductase [Goodfellowiella coeruleoviolacea]|uniref:FMN dependent NADH:quinone oxidoreductase n=1 Tax=Goodfellowiella coeruleoviolacea TaxID=334858 RepID=A0AAE3GBX0_9PSEU|nr:NAD(P)H-dependent oxidoreductase [Goodfellowiella coeruleoviolacea]MCP2164973.1 FMN-dependent NADH-azoreductase [Goodfellowiella coeruleoviolacea]